MDFDGYVNNIPYDTEEGKKELDAARKEAEKIVSKALEVRQAAVKKQHGLYSAEVARIQDLFKSDLEKEFGTAKNPKREKLFEKAWEDGHSEGYSAVYSAYQSLVELVK